MRAPTMLRLIPFVAAGLTAACTSDTSTSPAPGTVAASSVDSRRADDGDNEGAVYTMTNARGGNAVIAFKRGPNGSLSSIGSFATGGAGTGGTIDPLVSQYSLVLSDDHALLLAVNAGSNELTTFRVADDGGLSNPKLISSGGVTPVSVAARRNLVYVLNSGSNSLQGYRVGQSGRLAALPGARTPLPAGDGGASAVRFSRDGEHLLVTERLSNRIDVFAVSENGRLGAVRTFASNGRAAFGFDVTPDDAVIVSETGSNAPNGGLSSYALRGGSLALVTGSISSGGAAACWLLNTRSGRFSYVVNAASATIGAFAVSRRGALSPLAGGAASTSTGAGSTPLDPAFSAGDRFLYVLEGGSGKIGGFAVGDDGALTPAGVASAGAGGSGLQGLAAF